MTVNPLTPLFVTSMTVLGWWRLDAIFQLTGAEGQTLDLAREYMEIWLAGLGGISISQIHNNAMSDLGDMHAPSRIICWPPFST